MKSCPQMLRTGGQHSHAKVRKRPTGHPASSRPLVSPHLRPSSAAGIVPLSSLALAAPTLEGQVASDAARRAVDASESGVTHKGVESASSSLSQRPVHLGPTVAASLGHPAARSATFQGHPWAAVA